MLRLLLVWALAPGELDDEVLGDRDDNPAWLDADGEEPHIDAQHLLHGYALPGLIDYSRVDWTLEAEGLQGANDDFTSDARLRGQGHIEHPFLSEVEDLSIALGLYLPTQAQEAIDRLTKPPLHLTQADLDRKLPSPMATLSSGQLTISSLEVGSRADASFDRDLGALALNWHDMPAYIVVTDSYTLVDPTPDDIKLILERGGSADHAALTRWAAEHEDVRPNFGAEAREEIIGLVQRGYRRLRAPPALGDFQRLAAFVALIRTFGSSEDIESLLKLERPMKILHTSALLSYDLATREEASLGLPVHGMRALPSRSKLLDAPESALKSLRAPALHHLLRLAFDPVDFRDAPTTMASSSRSLASQAANLLAPLSPTDVGGVLKACEDRLDVQREVFRFYIDARHVPAVEPLVDWIATQGEDADGLGRLAVAAMPEAMLPGLMRHYVDPDEAEDRVVMRQLIEGMPPAQAKQVLEMLASLGLRIADIKGSPHEQMVQALDAFEQAERELAVEKANELRAQLESSGTDAASLRTSMRAAARLAQLDPDAIEQQGATIIDLLTAAAFEFDVESPAERTKALGYLESLPFGDHKDAAAHALALTQARLLIRQGDSSSALDQLVAHDAKLEHADIRKLFVDTLMAQFRRELASGAYAAARAMLDLAELRTPEDLDIEALRQDVLWAQYKPAFILGAAFALALATTLTWLLARVGMTLVGRFLRARRDFRRLRKRQEDAKANTEDQAQFSDADATAHAEAQPPTPPPNGTELAVDTDAPRVPDAPVAEPGEPAANDAPIEADEAPDDATRITGLEKVSVDPPSSVPQVDDALLGEFAVDDGFVDPLSDPFDDLNDDPFGDDFGWGRGLDNGTGNG